MTAWVSDLDDARALWPAAPLDDDLLEGLLTAAQEVCESYAPALADPLDVPDRYVQAVILQSQEVWNAAQREGDVVGFGDSGYAIRVRPLSTTVKALLRPRAAVPRVG
jgi:hypothetical protein